MGYLRKPQAVFEQARTLRIEGLSFSEIGHRLDINKETVRRWCDDIHIDQYESLRQKNLLARDIVKEPDIGIVRSLSDISPEQAKLYAALFYGCEGCKYPATSNVAFVNSDPAVIKTFIGLIRKAFCLDESKFRVHLQIHTTHDFEEIKSYWSVLLNIPVSQFAKATITIPRGKMRRQNYLGTCTLKYYDTKVQLRLIGLFERFCS